MRDLFVSVLAGIAVGAATYGITTAIDGLDVLLRILVAGGVALVAGSAAFVISRRVTKGSRDVASDITSKRGGLRVEGVGVSRSAEDGGASRTASGLKARGDINISDIKEEYK